MDDKDPNIKYRYFVTDAEEKLLRDNAPIYFGFGFRSQDRKDLVKKVLEELKKINVEWTEKKSVFGLEIMKRNMFTVHLLRMKPTPKLKFRNSHPND
jgi:hypothetical protein